MEISKEEMEDIINDCYEIINGHNYYRTRELDYNDIRHYNKFKYDYNDLLSWFNLLWGLFYNQIFILNRTISGKISYQYIHNCESYSYEIDFDKIDQYLKNEFIEIRNRKLETILNDR